MKKTRVFFEEADPGVAVMTEQSANALRRVIVIDVEVALLVFFAWGVTDGATAALRVEHATVVSESQAELSLQVFLAVVEVIEFWVLAPSLLFVVRILFPPLDIELALALQAP